jgi:hypothetical protein
VCMDKLNQLLQNVTLFWGQVLKFHGFGCHP